MMYVLLIAIGLVFTVLVLGFGLPGLTGKGVRVLMYHKVSTQQQDFLTVSTEQLDQQLRYLQENKYQIIDIQRLMDSIMTHKTLPPKTVLLTFDDGYLNNLTFAYPILQRYQAPATIFLPTAYLGVSSSWDESADTLMSVEQLKSLDSKLISFGLHSNEHKNYKRLTINEIEKDLDKCLTRFKQENLLFAPAFAYPYGARPKDKNLLAQMKTLFRQRGVQLAFRIGNRVNPFRPRDVYELNRIDIRGTDSFRTFQQKLRFGRVKPF